MPDPPGQIWLLYSTVSPPHGPGQNTMIWVVTPGSSASPKRTKTEELVVIGVAIPPPSKAPGKYGW